ncbi:type II 3-dehydroquinate dehydratase [Glaciecola petra]|uniref:3-dehydroquinate dehydratase n=1 Tax=Glaciecola petra TaxID=3075602 RepID=A0ABU2ZUX2_9ALTE|nr:type II 3-dehydroquinate dehydratase [Aestuariibacter sp. P117]MDT0595222.1 type II 3-dehydroquinate dehydratase [Aestuariibacter sp. P117]
MHILLLNGPNLNLLGTRQPDLYGQIRLEDIENSLKDLAQQKNVAVSCCQSNAEHEIIERIHKSKGVIDGIIINPAAYTHTSVAIRDALAGVAIPFVEVHISNVHQRENFRHHSYFSDIAIGTIVGLGAKGYDYAFDALVTTLQK